jgi:hypothetical protein
MVFSVDLCIVVVLDVDVCELLLHCCFEDVNYGARSFTIYVWHYGYGS